MILSFHPCIIGDKNIICAGREPDTDDLKSIRAASAVILPQGARESLYKMAKTNCSHVFPDYDARFGYPGKINQIVLFSKHYAAHPFTRYFKKLDLFFEAQKNGFNFEFPFVFKFDWGGEGDFVFFIQTKAEFENVIHQTEKYEKTGQFGFMLQTYIPNQHRSLRVVVINKKYISYWRVHEPHQFYSNLSKGAEIDKASDLHLQMKGNEAVKSFCQKTKINLAGFDLLFSENSSDPRPLFIEINYFFGRKGLGGSDNYYKLLEDEISSWLSERKRVK